MARVHSSKDLNFQSIRGHRSVAHHSVASLVIITALGNDAVASTDTLVPHAERHLVVRPDPIKTWTVATSPCANNPHCRVYEEQPGRRSAACPQGRTARRSLCTVRP